MNNQDTNTKPLNFDELYKKHIAPFWAESVIESSHKVEADIEIHFAYAYHDEHKNSIFISPGRIEGYLKYQEVMWYWYQKGYNVFCIDHRGQGLSTRELQNPHKGYIKDFSVYVADMEQVIEHHFVPRSKAKKFILAHSMGSAIATLYLQANPRVFDCAALCSPMYGIRSPFPRKLAFALAYFMDSINTAVGKQSWYFPSQLNYVDTPFLGNRITHSRSRYRWFRALYKKRPELQLGGVTNRWLAAAVDAMKLILSQANKLKTPTFILQAGSDRVVDNLAQDEFYEAVQGAGLECHLHTVLGAKHELLMESKDFQDEALENIENWFKHH